MAKFPLCPLFLQECWAKDYYGIPCISETAVYGLPNAVPRSYHILIVPNTKAERGERMHERTYEIRLVFTRV